jgi:hypothetical protein
VREGARADNSHPHQVIRRFVQSLVPVVALPDLRASIPDRYEIQSAAGAPMTVYVARNDADIALVASLVDRHHFYGRFAYEAR